MKKFLFITILLHLAMTKVIGQTVMLEKKVTIQYFDVKLEDALDDISKSYDVNFSYSKNLVPVSQLVSADVNDVPLSIALEHLLDETDVAYVGIDDQIILKIDPNKKKLINKGKPKEVFKKRKKIKQPELLSSTDDIRALYYYRRDVQVKYPLVKVVPIETPEPEKRLNPIEKLKMDIREITLEVDSAANDIFDEVESKSIEIENDFKELKNRTFQINLLGKTGTNGKNNTKRTNHISANILWGKSGAVEGIEVGGLVNSVVHDVKGIQIAGLGNSVGGDVIGTQVGGIFNVNKGKMIGVQGAGFINVSREVKYGMQVSGFGNIAGQKSKGSIQVSPVFNRNKGKALIQVAAINRAKNAKMQIGLINFADSSKVTIGLLNFVKRGYNRFEISGSEVLYFNAELKLGSNGFYNIFHLGFRPVNNNEGHLGFGYGIGTRFHPGKKRFSHNFELVASQINPSSKNVFSQPDRMKLNALGQFRWTFDFRVGRKTSLFLGPTFNALFSRYENLDTGEFGFGLVPYNFFNKTYTTTKTFTKDMVSVIEQKRTNIKMWAGVKAGIRF